LENKIAFALKFKPAKEAFYQLVFKKIDHSGGNIYGKMVQF